MVLNNREFQSTVWLLAGLTALFIVTWSTPVLKALHGIHAMPLAMHVAAETFAVVIAMLVFAITWNTYEANRATNTVLIGVGFLAVGLLDFGHMLSFKGMPDFVTPSGAEKAIQFWLSGRFVTALILFAVAFRIWKPLSDQRTRYVMLLTSLMITLGLYGLILFYGDELPHTFVEGQGLTPLKVAAEYVIIAILLVAAVRFYRQLAQGHKQSIDLFAASAITVLSELCFVLYSTVSDIFNLLGHVYKVIAYVYIYRAMFIDSVRKPMVKLKRARDDLSSSKRMLQSIVDNVPVRIFWKDRDGRYLGANKLFLHDAGVENTVQLGGQKDGEMFSKYSDKYRADDLEVMATRQPKLNIEEPLKLADDGEICILTNKVPLFDGKGDVIGILGAYLDITSLRDAERRLTEAHEQLRELTINREEAREGERKRIAQDLHDGLGQMLTSLRMELSLLRIQYGSDNPPLVMHVRSIMEHIDATIQMVRDVAAQLRPAVLDTGVVSALEWQVAEFTKRSGIPCSLMVDEAHISIDAEQATTIFRIVQESFTNIMRHAHASRVEVRLLQMTDHCLLEIRDDGVGFEPDLLHDNTFGLMGMRERALVLGGEFEIGSAPGQGTTIAIRIRACNCGRKHD